MQKRIYYPDQIWKRRFDYEKEFLIYRYLCKPTHRRECRKLDVEEKLVSFEDWETRIKESISKLSPHQQREFCKYARNKRRRLENREFLTSVFTTPLVISIVGTPMFNYISEMAAVLNEALHSMPVAVGDVLFKIILWTLGFSGIALAAFVAMLPLLLFVWILYVLVVNNVLDIGLKKNFWEDCEMVVQQMVASDLDKGHKVIL